MLDEQQRPGDQPAETTGGGARLLCARCRHPITTDDQRIAVNDQHEHFFVNPHGYDFHLGCFATAPGALGAGPSTAEWTWFSGYSWQLSHCRNCATHLGWLFRSPTHSFHGLVLDRLIGE
ncbi:MAG TPA: cereblon family protein [Kofleriaceae bacterium]|nr:cereblon family protein [Kofleriaceae bacterium]